MSSGLLRYRSAPTTLLADMCENFLPVRPSSPDTESLFARFMTAPDRTSLYTPPPKLTENFATHTPSRAEFSAPQMTYRTSGYQQQQQQMDVQYRGEEQIKMEEAGEGSFSSLIRQNSSPAGFFSHPDTENGFGVTRGLKNQLSFSPDLQGYPVNSWDDNPSLFSNGFAGVKRARDVETQAELQLQDAVLCKMRAKRGCATHPRSIAERVRRTRISERMRKLQELVPSMDKQTNTSDMLELAVEHIKDLQEQVKRLTEIRASCTCCSSKRLRYSNQEV